MAEEKNSIIVYADWIDKFEELSDDEAGRLIKHFFRYVNDQNPVAPDRITKLSFIDIEKSLKRDLKKWEVIKGKRSEAGKASAEAKRLAKEAEQNSTKSTHVESVKTNSTKSTVSVNVNDSVSVNVNENEIIKSIMDFFNFSETANYDKMRDSGIFVKLLIHTGNISNFITQFEAYKKLKSSSPKFTHSFKNFIGTDKEQFLDGAWNAENWVVKQNPVIVHPKATFVP